MKRFFCFVLMLTVLFCGTASGFVGFAQSGQASADTVYARGETPIAIVSERIDYAYKVETEYINPFSVPGYVSNYTCGITAGGVIVGHYDRIYEELIPNHNGRVLLGRWFYGTQGAEVNAMFSSLYTMMSATPQGVTMTGYLNGVTSYVASRGRNMTFTSVMTPTINTAQYRTALESGQLLSVFLDGFAIVSLSDLNTYASHDTVRFQISDGAHIMAAYGYLEIKYFNSSNVNFRTDTYLHIKTGFTMPTHALVSLNRFCTVDDIFISHIS